jgi:hypothetical protein
VNLKAANPVNYLYAETKRSSDGRHGKARVAKRKEWHCQNTGGKSPLCVA